MKANIIVGLSLILGLVQGAPLEDKVTTLEQWPGVGTLFDMYSGFLPINGTSRRFHYIFIGSESPTKAKDPVIFWFNGGPGCSSMFGLTMEIGPYVMGDEDTSFKRNENAWNKEANVVYIEMPAGVGFSTCDEMEDKGVCYNKVDNNTYELNDEMVANETFIAVQNLFRMKFPELFKNDLYLSGESYAGIYVPWLALKIDQFNEKESKDDFNLKGLMVGNGCTDFKYDTLPSGIDMLYQHHIISQDLYETYTAECVEKYPNFMLQYFDTKNPLSNECKKALYDIQAYLTVAKINTYNIYGKCYNFDDNDLNETSSQMLKQTKGYKGMSIEQYTPWASQLYRGQQHPNLKGAFTCGSGQPIAEFLNKPSVRKQLNIPDGGSQVWDFCNDKFHYLYQFDQKNGGSLWIYKLLKNKYRILKFSGDADSVVPALGSMRWISELGWKVTRKWRPYILNSEVIGYIEERDGLTFATVRHAGHAVPQYKPVESYYLIFNWLKGKADDL